MTPIANLVRQLGNAGCSIEQIAVAVAHQESLMHEAEQSRRAKNVARQKRYRDRDASLRHETQHNVTDCNAPLYKEVSKLEQKPKKVSVYISAENVPNEPSDEARDFAKSKGWDAAKTSHEWQRFRDYGIQKSRKHKGELGLAAAWRNWVTSPYQLKSTENGNVQTTQHHPGGAYGASKDRFREARAKLKAFAEQDDGESGGSVVELLSAAGRERA